MFLIPLQEGYGRLYEIDYLNAEHDSHPKVLFLGKWRHPNTRNELIAGINLNELNQQELILLRRNLADILKNRNLKNRYWAGRELLPDVFNKAYRTYDARYVGSVTKGTLKFIRPTDDDENKALELAQEEDPTVGTLDELPPEKRLEYTNKAIIDRHLQTMPPGTPQTPKRQRTPGTGPVTAQKQQAEKDAKAMPAPEQPVIPPKPGQTPPPPPDQGPDEMGTAVAAPKPPKPPAPPVGLTSPQRRRLGQTPPPVPPAAPGPGAPVPPPSSSKEPAREAPKAPDVGKTPGPTPVPPSLTSPQRRRDGAAKAIEKKMKKDYGIDEQ